MRFEGNAATEHGKKYEPIAITKYKQLSGAKVFFVRFMLHPEYSFIGGTFDGLAILSDGEGVLIEVKCPYTRGIGGSVPEHYVGQVQSYLAIAGLDRCLFIQYKPPYVTPGRGFHRPEKLSVLTVVRDPGYFSSRVFRLWDFYKRLCAFRKGVLPTASAAATVIQTMWRFRHNIRGISVLKVKLSAIEYNRVRRAHIGIKETTEHILETTQRPFVHELPIVDVSKLVVVVDSDPPAMKAHENLEHHKRKSPDCPQENEDSQTDKKSRQ